MHTEQDVSRIVRSWLRTDEHESADRVLDDVLLVLDATPQRRPHWPARRIATVNTTAKFAIAAAAVVLVAVVGINLLPSTGGVGGIAASLSPSPTATPTSSLPPNPAESFPPAGELAIGRHSMIREGVRFSINVAASGWRSQQGFEFIKGTEGQPDGAGLLFWSLTPDNVYANPCAHTPLTPAAGPGIASLATAVSRIPGTELVSGPTDLTVDGQPVKRTVITIPEDIDCAGVLKLWYDDGMGSEAGRFPTVLPSTMRVWMFDVDGTTVWIDGETYESDEDTSPTLEREIQQMIESIVFE
jgi:hypothetical protein